MSLNSNHHHPATRLAAITALVLTLFVAAPMLTAPAAAQDSESARIHEYAIPPGSLGEVLGRFAAESNILLSGNGGLTSGQRSQGLQGRFSVAEGLRRLLSGTGLTARFQDDDTVMLVRTAGNGDGAESLEPVLVRAKDHDPSRRTQTRTEISGRTTTDYNPANAVDSLRMVPGVMFFDGTRFASPTRIRGSASNASTIAGYPAIRKAGVGTEDGGYGTDLGAMVPGIAIRHINVVKGGLGVRYGGDVDGGLVEFELDRGRPGPPSGEVVLDQSTLPETLAMADAGGGTADGKWDYYVAGKTVHGDYDDVTLRFGDEQETQEFYSGLFRGGHQWNDETRLETVAIAGRERHDYNDQNGDFHSVNKSLLAGVSAENETGLDNWGWRTGYTYYYTRGTRFVEATGGVNRDRPQTVHSVFGELGNHTEVSDKIDWAYALGVDYIDQSQHEDRPGRLKDQYFKDTSVWLTNTVTVDERWTLNGGARYASLKDNGGSDDVTSYEASVAREFENTGTRLYASYSSSFFRARGYAFFGSNQLGLDEIPGGTPVTETETREIGIRQSLPLTHGGYVDLAVYDKDVENVPVLQALFPDDNPQIAFDDNEVRGVEVFAELGLSEQLDATLSYSYHDSEINEATFDTVNRVGDTASNTPEHTGAVALGYQYSSNLRLSTIATYESGLRTIDDSPSGVTVTEFGSFVRWNALAEWRINDNAVITFRIENLLDERDLNFDSRRTAPDGTVAVNDSDGEDPGRIYAVGFRYQY